MILEDTILTKSEYIRHAANIAEKHLSGRYEKKHLPDTEKNGEIIFNTYNRIMSGGESASLGINAIPSDEWIADNYHLIRESIENVISEDRKKTNLYAVYEIAEEIISHTDGIVGETQILDFISAYEKVRPLNMKELGGVCLMLKIALINRIAEICVISDKIFMDRKSAEKIFREFSSFSDSKDAYLARSAKILFENEEMLSPVYAETILRLSAERSESDATRIALSGKLATRGTTVEELIAREHSTRISLGISAGNVIKSLSGISSIDWGSIISELCVTEQILSKDPAGIFGQMTPETKSEYVRLVGVCAKRKHIKPEEFALDILALAEKENTHVGKYIYNEYTKKKDFGAFLCMFIFTAFVLALCPAAYVMMLSWQMYGIYGFLIGIFCTLLILSITFNISITLSQQIYMEKKMPYTLPELNFNGKLPENVKVMIVLPCLINSKKRIDEMMYQLEAAAWANPQDGIYYTLLADLPEGKSKTNSQDSTLIQYANMQIEKINKKFNLLLEHAEKKRFHILIRERVFYEEDNKWMGAERKRGALIELNRAVINGTLPKVNYVLTVDADTVIPVNTAVKMAQIMHHPLNKPEINYINGEPVVVNGYAILQPAVSLSGLEREKATLFEKIYSNETGFDSYQCKTSDFYFDVCHEGIYTGKGMYDPYVFNAITDGRFKGNSILSHDLLEGSFLRTGFVSDVHLYDSFPKTFGAYVKREHRWIRGDWQLLPFMGKRFESENGSMKNNPLNFYSLFKMKMNLLRSFLPEALFLLLVFGTFFFKNAAALWISAVFITLFAVSAGKFPQRILRCVLDFAFLPYNAFYHCDAMARALWRTYVSRKNMLEWVVSSDCDKKTQDSPLYYCKMMWFNFLAAALTAPYYFGIVSILWIAAPYCAYFISLKNKTKHSGITEKQRKAYRILARKIWAFYDDYAVRNENYLPPDNVQFSPVYSVAHRTSPTNIGFLIISIVIAERFGYISKAEMIFRLNETTDTLKKMEKWNGHIFNWYDTITLQPLEPKYVSGVDSGNLAACLLTAAALLDSYRNHEYNSKEKAEEDIKRISEGLLDTAYCLNEMTDSENYIDTHILEEFLKKGKPDEFINILNHYIQTVHTIPDEKADAHSFRCKFIEMLENAEKNIRDGSANFIQEAQNIALKMTDIALSMNFSVLYNEKRKHMHIGFNYSSGKYSDSYYDMLMSEARLTSYIAMAKGDVDKTHFTALARRYDARGRALLSWSGTVFEYLLPEQFISSPEGSDLKKSVYEMLRMQKNSAEGRPWGISESGYNVLDVNMNYKYKAFGIKSLAVKRMHQDDAVVAPYASIMACEYLPDEVYKNMEFIKSLGGSGKYGFYEAIDFTHGRKGVVQSYMAHHMGMSLCGIANLLQDNMISSCFGNMPMMQSIKVMMTAKSEKGKPDKYKRLHGASQNKKCSVNIYNIPEKEEDAPAALSGHDSEVLSNGKYSMIVNGMGENYSTFENIRVNVYGEGSCKQGVMMFINGTAVKPSKCSVSAGRAEYIYFEGDEEITQSICVDAEENAQIHHIKIANKGKEERHDNITLYTELVMAPIQSYEAHPSYSGLFITTDAPFKEKNKVCLTAKRRRHKLSEKQIETYCFLGAEDKFEQNVESVSYDTDIMTFKGRNRHACNPVVFEGAGAKSDVYMSSCTGIVLNPCFAVNAKIRIESSESAELYFVLGICTDESVSDDILSIRRKIEKSGNVQRIFELSRTRSIVEKEHISLKAGDLQYFRRFGQKLLYGKKYFGSGLQRELWSFGISGDNPIITVMVRKIENAVNVEKIVRMWCFYSFRGIKIDLVLAVFDNADYISPIHELADNLAQRAMWGCFPVRGDIFVIVPKDGQNAAPLLEASNIVFWM